MTENETTAGGMPNTESVKADWGALKELQDVVVQDNPPVTEEVKTEPEIKPEEANLETTKPEPTPEEIAKTETETLAKEAKELGLEDTATKEEVEAAKTLKAEADKPAIEFKVEDITDVPKDYEDGTFGALAKELGVELTEDSFDAFKSSFVPVAELEKAKSETIETIFSKLKPETAAALKLIEAGMSEEQIFAPTKQIDEYLSLDDAALVRKEFELQGILTEEIIDNKMEQMSADPKQLKLMADELRIYLNEEKNNKIQERTQTLQKYEAQRQNALLQQKEQERTQIVKALNDVKSFMGVPLSQEIKDAMVKKYNNGLYDNDLNNASVKAEFLLQRELGDKLAKHIQNKASSDAKKEVTNKLLNIPPVLGNAGQKVNKANQPTIDNPWSALEELKT